MDMETGTVMLPAGIYPCVVAVVLPVTTAPLIRGIIFIWLPPLGAGMRPTPLGPVRGDDIFCLDLGLERPVEATTPAALSIGRVD